MEMNLNPDKSSDTLTMNEETRCVLLSLLRDMKDSKEEEQMKVDLSPGKSYMWHPSQRFVRFKVDAGVLVLRLDQIVGYSEIEGSRVINGTTSMLNPWIDRIVFRKDGTKFRVKEFPKGFKGMFEPKEIIS